MASWLALSCLAAATCCAFETLRVVAGAPFIWSMTVTGLLARMAGTSFWSILLASRRVNCRLGGDAAPAVAGIAPATIKAAIARTAPNRRFMDLPFRPVGLLPDRSNRTPLGYPGRVQPGVWWRRIPGRPAGPPEAGDWTANVQPGTDNGQTVLPARGYSRGARAHRLLCLYGRRLVSGEL